MIPVSDRNTALLTRKNRGNVYLGSRYSRAEEMRGYREAINAAGYYVTPRWIDGDHEWVTVPDEKMPVEVGRMFAQEDLLDLGMADVAIFFTEEPGSPGRGRGGRHVEFGWALARFKTIAVVGPRENVFYCVRGVHQFDTWEECLIWLTTR